MNASDSDRPESPNDAPPEAPVPSEPRSRTSAETGDAASGENVDEAADSAADKAAGTAGEASEEASEETADASESGESHPGSRVPEPIQPAEGQVVDEPSATFEWERVEGADNYQLQIAKDRGFEALVFDGRVGSSSRFTYSGLPPQEGFTLYWRVRAHTDGAWTDFGTIGTFVLADWRPEQPALAQRDADAPVAGSETGDSSRAEPILVMFTLAVTIVAIGLSIVYMQNSVSLTSGEDTPATETVEGDTSDLDISEPVPNEDGETFKIPIEDAMRQVVRERGGTWAGSDADATARQAGVETEDGSGSTP